jgi:hypothetical protein
MHIQIVNFNLHNVTPDEFERFCVETAEQFAALPGLISKVYLADPNSNTFGGIYTWQDKDACDSFKTTDLFHTVATHPGLANITSREFGVLETPTRMTRGLATLTSAA